MATGYIEHLEASEVLYSTVASIRPYAPADEEHLLKVWNTALYADTVAVETWRTKVLLDPNFDPEGCLVADISGAVRGFVLSIVRRVPFYNDGLDKGTAWITAMGVEPEVQRQGLGSWLLKAVENRLRELGCTRVLLSPYVPNYFTPGVDVEAYAQGVTFLQRRGYEIASRPLSMRAELTGFRIPESINTARERLFAEGITVRLATPTDIVPVLQFLVRDFAWDWHREASGIFADLFAGDPRNVSLLVATRGEEIVGYAQHRGERFGPFGVSPALRGRGIGRVLLAEALVNMRRKNFHCAWFLWTGDDAARLYAQCGFHEVRRFAVMSKAL